MPSENAVVTAARNAANAGLMVFQCRLLCETDIMMQSGYRYPAAADDGASKLLSQIVAEGWELAGMAITPARTIGQLVCIYAFRRKV
ncbi:hypothetical protein [Dactylosporangium sp. NPDC049140]|jgi:hypothetical protein|uniref:hypothetical protein n=1 Tax=Dactylosporangium sp. NPDC049140 TaxID=3155647 RepID=UPI00340B679D